MGSSRAPDTPLITMTYTHNNIGTHIRIATTVGATGLPVSINDFKNFIKLPESDAEEDMLIESLIQAAWRYVESVTGKVLLPETRTMKLDFFPTTYFVLPDRPVTEITSITYVDRDEQSQTYSSSNYVLDADRPLARIYLKSPAVRPSSLSDNPLAVTVTYTCGYSDLEDVPSALLHAVKLLASHWYDTRTVQIVGTIVAQSSMLLDALLGPYTLPKL